MESTNNSKYFLQEYNQEIWETMRTSFLTAFPRIFTSIPYSVAIFDEMLKSAVEYGFIIDPSLFVAKMAVELEGRYNAVTEAINTCLRADNDITIIELGAGLSPRRFEFEEIDYYEFDYPVVCSIKKDIIKRLGKSINPCYFLGLDITQPEQFRNAIENIVKSSKGKRIIFNSEGLFWYLTSDELSRLSDVVISVIKETGGAWITGDTPIDTQIDLPDYRLTIADSANKRINEPFDSYSSFCDFFDNYGCEVSSKQIKELIDINRLLSYKLFGVEEGELLSRLDSYSDISLITAK